MSGIAVVKAYAMEGATQEQFDEATENLYRRHLRLVRVSSAIPTLARLLPGLAMWIVLWFGGRAVQGRADGRSTVLRIRAVHPPVDLPDGDRRLGSSPSCSEAAASMDRVREILDTEPTIQTRPDAVVPKDVRGEIEFKGLDFAYRDGGGASHSRGCSSAGFPPGAFSASPGRWAPARPPWFPLIPRLFELPDGALAIDGVDVNDWDLATLRQNIAMVPQDSFLFSMSLADNIAYGLGETNLVDVSPRRRSRSAGRGRRRVAPSLRGPSWESAA